MGEKRNSRWRARLETVRQPIIIIFNPAQFVVVGNEGSKGSVGVGGGVGFGIGVSSAEKGVVSDAWESWCGAGV